MGLFAVVALWVALLFWAALLVSRAAIDEPGERILWYLIVFAVPILGALLVWIRLGRRERPEALELRMTRAVADARRCNDQVTADSPTAGDRGRSRSAT